MKRIVSLVVVAFSLTACTRVSWRSYSSPKGDYTVDLPTAPSVTVKDEPILGTGKTFHSESTRAKAGGIEVAITEMDMPMAVPSTDYDRVLGPPRKLTVTGNVNAATVQGRPARTYTAELPLGVGTCRERSVLDGMKVYNITICGRSGVPEEAATRVLDSFKLSH